MEKFKTEAYNVLYRYLKWASVTWTYNTPYDWPYICKFINITLNLAGMLVGFTSSVVTN